MDTTNLFHSQAVHADKKTNDTSLNSAFDRQASSLTPNRNQKSGNSLSLETLLSIQDQNNEKLKVTLRRLSIYENEIQELKKKIEDHNHEKSVLSDQIYVLREKDKASRLSIDELAELTEVLEVKNTALTEKTQTQFLEIQRLQRYQEKIKTQVKPYFAQLKDYSKSLETQHKRVVEQLEQKELALRELRGQMNELIKNYQAQIDSDNMKISKITESYESEIHQLKNELADTQNKLDFTEKQRDENQEYYNRFLDLENQKIELQRVIENKQATLSVMAEEYKAKELELKKFNYKHESENKDLKITLNLLSKENQDLAQKNLDIEQQLESMKFLWNQKNKETDKLKAALESLENINLELSKQLNSKS
jgi:chromosome segregation ATPase